MTRTLRNHDERRSDSNRRVDPGRRRLPRFRGTAAVATALLGFVLLAAGCSSGPRGDAQSSAGPMAHLLAYAKCVRAHGIPDFPDPVSNKGGPAGGPGFNLSGGGSDLDPNNPRYKAANQACQSLLPAPSVAQQQQWMAQALTYSKCMRSHSISDFPDPTASGGITIHAQAGSGGSDLNPNNPQFQAAQRACQHYLPAHPAGGGAP
jgi:hypothetical protein